MGGVSMIDFCQKNLIKITSEFLGEEISVDKFDMAENTLFNRWYNSNCTDFSIYDDNLTIFWLLKHSQRCISYIKNSAPYLSKFNPKIIIDRPKIWSKIIDSK